MRDGLTPNPVYINAPDEEAPLAPGAASRARLHRSPLALDSELRERGSRLIILGARCNLLLSADNHNSINGIRAYARATGE